MVNFFVLLHQISSGGYKFTDLVQDVVSRCPSLNHLNVGNIRIRYQDDEGSYINLNYGYEYGFRDMWDNARSVHVPDREYKRIKIKACEIDSPCGIFAQQKKDATATSVTHKPRQLYLLPEKGDYEYLSAERKKKSKICSETRGECELSTSDPNINLLKTPVERLLDNLENNIGKLSCEIEIKETELKCFNDSIDVALTHNDGTLPVCGQCHLREGHTKRNCQLGVCLSVKSCGLIDKHPNDKGKRKKLESEIATLKKDLSKSQENYRLKKTAYSKVNESFVCKVEQELIHSDPTLYIQNGCKNWSLIHKHAAILEQKCKGKLPKRNDIQKLLKSAQRADGDMSDNSDSSETDEEICSTGRLTRVQTTAGNLAKKMLEKHGVIFPETKNATCCSTTASKSLYRCAPSSKLEEQEQLKMALNQSILEQCDGNVTPTNGPIYYFPQPTFPLYPTNFPLTHASFISPHTSLSMQENTSAAYDQPTVYNHPPQPVPQPPSAVDGIVFGNTEVGPKPTESAVGCNKTSTADSEDVNDSAEALLTLMGI